MRGPFDVSVVFLNDKRNQIGSPTLGLAVGEIRQSAGNTFHCLVYFNPGPGAPSGGHTYQADWNKHEERWEVMTT